MDKRILYGLFSLIYLIFIIFIFIGGGFLTNIVFKKSDDELAVVGLNTPDKIRISQMIVVLFWIVFIPLCIIPLILLIKNTINSMPTRCSRLSDILI